MDRELALVDAYTFFHECGDWWMSNRLLDFEDVLAMASEFSMYPVDLTMRYQDDDLGSLLDGLELMRLMVSGYKKYVAEDEYYTMEVYLFDGKPIHAEINRYYGERYQDGDGYSVVDCSIEDISRAKADELMLYVIDELRKIM